MWILQDNTIIKTPVQVTIDGKTYPRLIFTEPDTIVGLGIKEYHEIVPDNKYYWNGAYTLDRTDDTVIGTYASNPRDVEQLKEGMLSTINSQVSSIQGGIDWYWSRASKGGKAVPTEIEAFATTIYAEQVTKEAEVTALTTLEDVMLYEATPYTEVRKVEHYSGEGVETYGPELEEPATRHINMLMHWTTNPMDEIDPAFVSLTAV
jgi:hypothetical protein